MKEIKPFKKTVFNTPGITPLVRFFCRIILYYIRGWKKEGEMPQGCKRCIIIAAPHSSYWDFPITLSFFLLFRLKKVYWTGRESLFRFPLLGSAFKWLGGIPIDRSSRNNYVEQLVELLRTNEEIMIVIQPEGTRKPVKDWKTGFYNVAKKANVRIILGFLDYAKKTGGVLGTVVPSKEKSAETEIQEIRNRYKGITGKNHN